jgi:Holliday junction DNA helicase RuvA
MAPMIAMVEGEVVALGPDEVTLMVGGIGLRIYIPGSLTSQLKMRENLLLFTHLVVREDALTLYGFEDEREKAYFQLLLGANGVGPRIALAIISMLSIETIRAAVLQEQVDTFARVPGVGRKTAQKIILHMQGKVGDAGALGTAAGLTDIDGEVVEALISLGYSVVEAQAALQSIPRDTEKDVETRLRLALGYFSQ